MRARGASGGGRGIALSAALLAAPAFAQSANISPPAEKFAIAPGGVDMRSGRYVYNQTDLAIGGEEGGIALARSLAQPVLGHSNPFGNFSHDWEIIISEKRINITGGQFSHGQGNPDYQIEIAFGGLSQTFRAVGTTAFEQVSRSGWARLSHSGSRDSAGAVYTLQTGDGTRAVFRAMGSNDCSSQLRCAYVDYMIRADGTRFDFGYDNAGANGTRLRTVASNRGFALLFEYASGRVSKACLFNLAATPLPAGLLCPSGVPTATYTYVTVGGAAKLASVVDAAGEAWGFTYNGAAMGFVRPGGSAPWLVNTIQLWGDDDGLVSELVTGQSFADGTSYNYQFFSAPPITGHVAPIAGGSFTDSLGRTTTLEYDFPTQPYDPNQGHGNVSGTDESAGPQVQQTTPGPARVTDPLGRVTTTDYCDPSLMASLPSNWPHRCLVMPVPFSVVSPEGIRTEMTWNIQTRHLLEARQLPRAGSPLAPIVQQASYNCSLANFRFCNQPVTRTDARGANTDYAYDPAHGGLVSETGPASAAGAPRPQTRHSYVQRSAWVASGGGYAQAATPVWLRAATSSCRTSAATGNPASPCAAGAADEVRIDYDYGPNSGPNNLLLRGQTVTATDNGVVAVLRTCFAYDSLGRRLAETQPNANLASCP